MHWSCERLKDWTTLTMTYEIVKSNIGWFTTIWKVSLRKDGVIMEDASNDVEKKEHDEWQICDKKIKCLMLM